MEQGEPSHSDRISFGGSYSLRDRCIRSTGAIGYRCLIGIAWIGFLSNAVPVLLIGDVAVALAVLFPFVVLYSFLFITFRLAKRESVSGYLDSDGVYLSDGAASSYLAWSHWSHYSQVGFSPVLVLYRKNNTVVPLPRRFFDGDQQWQAALQHMQSIIPVGAPRGTAHDPDNPYSAPVRMESVTADTPPSESELWPIEGRLTPDNLEHALRLAGHHAFSGGFFLKMCVVLVIIALVGILLGPPFEEFAIYIAVTFLPIFAFGLFFSRRRLRRIESPMIRARFNNEGLAAVVEGQFITVPWSSFQDYRISEHPEPLLVLFRSDDIDPFPKRFFASDELWESFVSHVREHVKKE